MTKKFNCLNCNNRVEEIIDSWCKLFKIQVDYSTSCKKNKCIHIERSCNKCFGCDICYTTIKG